MTHDCVDDLFNMVIHQVLIYLIYLMIQLLNMAMASIAKCWMIGWPEVQFWLERWSHSWHHKKLVEFWGCEEAEAWRSGYQRFSLLQMSFIHQNMLKSETWELHDIFDIVWLEVQAWGSPSSCFFLQQMRLYCILGAAGTTHVWAIAMFKWCFKTLSWYDTES